MDPYGVDQLVDEDATLAIVGGLPECFGVEVTEQVGDALERVGELMPPFRLFQILGSAFLDGLDLPGQFAFLLGEQGRGDLVGVVEIEDLLAFPTLETPAPMYATEEARAGVIRHAAFGNKVEKWATEKKPRREADAIRAAVLPAQV